MTETRERREPATKQSPFGATWIRLSRVAALVTVVWSVMLQSLVGALIPPVLVVGLVFLVFAVTLRPERRKLAMVAGATAIVSVLANLRVVIDELNHPSSPQAFLLTLTVTSAMAVIAIAGLAVWRRWRTSRMALVAFSWIGVVVVGVALALVAAGSVGSVDALSGDIEVTTKALQFDPGGASVSMGRFGVWVDNQDGVRHTFTIPGVGGLDIPALSAQRTDFELPAGFYQVICAVPGHENMVFELRVEG